MTNTIYSLLKTTVLKAVVLLFILFGSNGLNGQFTVSLSRLYTESSFIGNGVNCNTTGPGHLMGTTGYATFTNGLNANSVNVIRTDFDGRTFMPGTFNKTYEFIDQTSGKKLNINSTRAIELADGTGYICVGAYSVERPGQVAHNGIGYGILFVELDLNGNLVSFTQQDVMAGTATSSYDLDGINVTGLKQKDPGLSTPDNFFVIGQVFQQEESQMYILTIDRTGAQTPWIGQYIDLSGMPAGTVEMPLDIIQNPFNMSSQAPWYNSVFLVGYVESAGNRDAFIMTLSPRFGIPSNLEINNFGGQDAFTSIEALTQGTNNGFILTGYANGEVLVSKLDVNGVNLWNNSYADLNDPGNEQAGYDIKPIWDLSAQNYTFYVAGSRRTFPRNIMTLVLDETGVSLGMSDLDMGNDEYAVSIDGSTYYDITFYGQHLDPSIYQTPYSLFNWKCWGAHSPTTSTSYSWTPYNKPTVIDWLFVQKNTLFSQIIDNSDYHWCQAEISKTDDTPADPFTDHRPGFYDNYTKPGNQYKGDVYQKGGMHTLAGISVYPNPANKFISIEVTGTVVAEVRIQNVQGVLIGYAVKESENIFRFATEELPSGVYFVEVVSNNGTQVSKFIKE